MSRNYRFHNPEAPYFVISQKIRYIHNNPVEQGLVFRPEDYPYSSAVDYSGEKGVLNGVVVVGL